MEMQFPVILDGATGTELQKRGFTGDMSAEQWVLEHPESILEIQRKYVASGSNVLYAPTFGGNRQKLEERGIFNRTEEMNKALVQLSKQAADGKAWVASGKILSGTDVVAALSVMEGMGASAFGLNCSAGPEQMLPQLQRLHKYAHVPLIAKPNAGMPEIVNGEAVYNCPPEEFAALVPEMLKAGVALFGGCCGTTEEHIAALKAALKDAEYVRPAPECLDLLPAATEKEAFFLPADATHGAVLTADGDLEDKLSDAMDDEWPMVALKLASWADVDALADYQYMIRKPLCLICDDAELLEAGLRAYQGRALYEGNLTEDALAPLVEKYGLLV